MSKSIVLLLPNSSVYESINPPEESKDRDVKTFVSSNRLERSTVKVEASSLVNVRIPEESIVPVDIALNFIQETARSTEFPLLIDNTLTYQVIMFDLYRLIDEQGQLYYCYLIHCMRV